MGDKRRDLTGTPQKHPPGESGTPLSVGVAIVLTLAALGALTALGFVVGVWARVGG